MKKIATMILMVLSISLFTNAQQVDENKDAKTYSWNETTHDFGTLPQAVPATVTFTVTNKGTAPMVMTAAKSSCGCTVAEYTKEPIKSGETGIVKATYNAAKPGKFTKTVIVTFDGIAQGDVLTLTGEVEAKSTE